MLDFRALWEQALPYHEFVAASDLKHRGLWHGLHHLARIPSWALAAIPADTTRKLLVLAEDWCGDASNTIPVLAKLADLAPGLALRILRRDEHPEVMSQYLTNGTRSIPVVIALDSDFHELGRWGPRPHALQEWVLDQRSKGTPKDRLYPEVRRWYARDAGQTTLREVLTAAGLSAARVA